MWKNCPKHAYCSNVLNLRIWALYMENRLLPLRIIRNWDGKIVLNDLGMIDVIIRVLISRRIKQKEI
jgi:hypothetical protein